MRGERHPEFNARPMLAFQRGSRSSNVVSVLFSIVNNCCSAFCYKFKVRTDFAYFKIQNLNLNQDYLVVQAIEIIIITVKRKGAVGHRVYFLSNALFGGMVWEV